METLNGKRLKTEQENIKKTAIEKNGIWAQVKKNAGMNR